MSTYTSNRKLRLRVGNIVNNASNIFTLRIYFYFLFLQKKVNNLTCRYLDKFDRKILCFFSGLISRFIRDLRNSTSSKGPLELSYDYDNNPQHQQYAGQTQNCVNEIFCTIRNCCVTAFFGYDSNACPNHH